jgi:hypothetical protein
VNVELNAVSGWPSRSVIPEVALIWYSVEAANEDEGVKVTVRPSDETVIVPAIVA